MELTPHVSTIAQYLLATPFLIAFIFYGWGVMRSDQRPLVRPWSWMRIVCWIGGVICAILAVSGPLAARSHADFTVHMIVHLLLGMLAPLLIVCSAPISLLLRSLPARHAKKAVNLFKIFPFRFMIDPLVASILNIGGLWLLYKTNLFQAMHAHVFVHVIVHLHVFLAGYVFTASMLYIDPIPHRRSFTYRSIVLILALAGHQILSKSLYAYPPKGVDPYQAQIGSMLMYYGGDLIDAVIIFLLCWQWYQSARPRYGRHL